MQALSMKQYSSVLGTRVVIHELAIKYCTVARKKMGKVVPFPYSTVGCHEGQFMSHTTSHIIMAPN